MSSKVERLRAELALAELEEEYVAAKDVYVAAMDAFVEERVASRPEGASIVETVRLAKADFTTDHEASAAYQDTKARLNAARGEFRTNHRRKPAGKGDAAPSPAPVEAAVGFVGEEA